MFDPINKILGKGINIDIRSKSKEKNKRQSYGREGYDRDDYCKICGNKVGKNNVYGKTGCSECAYLNEED